MSGGRSSRLAAKIERDQQRRLAVLERLERQRRLAEQEAGGAPSADPLTTE